MLQNTFDSSPSGPARRDAILVIGGGIAGQAVCEAVRARDAQVPLTLLCAEQHRPYDRVRLGSLLAREASVDGLRLRPDAWYEDADIEVVTGARVAELDPQAGCATLSSGQQLGFGRAVLCTGSDAFVPPIPGAQAHGVHVFRDPADCARIVAGATSPQGARSEERRVGKECRL